MKALTGAERGYLLLTSELGNAARKPLTVSQFRELTRRTVRHIGGELNREMEIQDFVSMGYSRSESGHLLDLLQEEDALDRYLCQARRYGCIPITRATESYPTLVRKRLGLDAPGVLWAKGDVSLLNRPAVSLVGSRELREENRVFAEEAGRQVALQDLVLVSGNARGADKTAQSACLRAGGAVISVVADSLLKHCPGENVLYISENGFDEPFSAQRALSRNRVIHALGRITFVAQSDFRKGGTWAGTVKNLNHGWSPVACFRDGSEASGELEQMGAFGVGVEDLADLSALTVPESSLFDR